MFIGYQAFGKSEMMAPCSNASHNNAADNDDDDDDV